MNSSRLFHCFNAALFPTRLTQLAHNVVSTFIQRYLDVMDVIWTSFRRCVESIFQWAAFSWCSCYKDFKSSTQFFTSFSLFSSAMHLVVMVFNIVTFCVTMKTVTNRPKLNVLNMILNLLFKKRASALRALYGKLKNGER